MLLEKTWAANFEEDQQNQPQEDEEAIQRKEKGEDNQQNIRI